MILVGRHFIAIAFNIQFLFQAIEASANNRTQSPLIWLAIADDASEISICPTIYPVRLGPWRCIYEIWLFLSFLLYYLCLVVCKWAKNQHHNELITIAFKRSRPNKTQKTKSRIGRTHCRTGRLFCPAKQTINGPAYNGWKCETSIIITLN